MPWEERGLAQMRKEFVERVQTGEKSKSELCREYGITRRTGDKWIARYEAGESLADQSRRPFHTPNKTNEANEAIESAIVDYRREHPAIGALKIHRILENKGYTGLPSVKTVNNILKRNNLIEPEASTAATPYKRFQKGAPNEMWQADYKGHFALKNGQRCHPLNIIDDCSRFNLCSKAQASETFGELKPQLISVFEEYGVPFSILCDNGNPWGTQQSIGFTHFEVWLMEHGVLTLHGRPIHPQTQGKEESFNRSMTKELLKFKQFEDMEDADRQFQIYREFYNNERPHHALDLDTPSQRYVRSERDYSDEVEPWEYPEGCSIRKMKSSGYVTLNGQGFFLSEAFGEKEIAVRESHTAGRINLYFHQFKIAQIDMDRRAFVFRKAYLIDDDPRFENNGSIHQNGRRI